MMQNPPSLNLELVAVTTVDGVELDGAWYRGAPSQVGALLIPGRAQNFYTSVVRWLAPFLAGRGIPTLSLNTRDHDHSEIDGVPASVQDIEAGLAFLKAQGCTQPLIAGVSYGSNKVALYVAQANQQPLGVILLSVGGIKLYRPELWADVLAGLGCLTAPLLVITAAGDEYMKDTHIPGQEMVAAAARSKSAVMTAVEGANHGFSQHKEEVKRIVGKWLEEEIGLA